MPTRKKRAQSPFLLLVSSGAGHGHFTIDPIESVLRYHNSPIFVRIRKTRWHSVDSLMSLIFLYHLPSIILINISLDQIRLWIERLIFKKSTYVSFHSQLLPMQTNAQWSDLVNSIVRQHLPSNSCISLQVETHITSLEWWRNIIVMNISTWLNIFQFFSPFPIISLCQKKI